MIWRVVVLAAVLVFFLASTASALLQHGYLGFFDAMQANAATRLAMLDLTIVLTLALIWMFRDARPSGLTLVEWAVYALVTIGFGAAGPLLYLIRREFALRSHGAPIRERGVKLYHFTLSPFSAKVRIALREKGLDFEDVDLPITRRGFASEPPELRRLNPRGQVPILVDGELPVYDSTVILEYLEDRAPQPALYPKDAAGRARCRQLEDAGDEAMTLAVALLIDEVWRKTDPAERDAARIAEGARQVAAFCDRLEAALGSSEFLCGAFSVADISCFIPVFMASALGAPPRDTNPCVSSWIARCSARPAIAHDIAAMAAASSKMSG